MAWNNHAPVNAGYLTDKIAYSWNCYDPEGDNDQGLPESDHVHAIDCLYVWHDCDQTLGPASVAPGERFGWRPAGVRAHTLVTIDPLTITASVYWPDCCGVHGFITDGRWIDA